MTRSAAWITLAGLAVATGPASATTVPRHHTNLRGDFILIGNTMGQTCASPAPTVGTVGRCVERSQAPDLSPDLFWRAETSSATADTSVTPDRMRSTAVLTLPPGATVTKAYLYWWGEVDDVIPDSDVILERPGGPQATLIAERSDTYTQLNVDAVQAHYAETLDYLSVTDATAFVAQQGSGPFRVSGVAAHPLDDNFNIAYAGWALIVLYQRPGDPPRNISLFDGIERVVGSTVGVALDGFLVPSGGFDGKLGIVGLDGELDGAQLRFGTGRLTAANALSDAQNPINRFFNGSRSYLGAAVSVAGDLPRTTGRPGSLGGVDYDVVDITSRLSGGQTSARAEVAAGPNDGIQPLIWVVAVTTLRPDLEDFTKTAVDENGGDVEVQDVLEYTLRLHNLGNDDAVGVLLTDVLPPSLEYQPGSMVLTSSAASGALTDAMGDDDGDFDPLSNTLRVRLGHSTTATVGGRLAIGEGARLRFRARIIAGSGGREISNQAFLVTAGARGARTATIASDGEPLVAGDQPTTVIIAHDPMIDAGSPEDSAILDVAIEDSGLDAGEIALDAQAPEDTGTVADASAYDGGTRVDAGLSAADAGSTSDAGLPVEGGGCNCQGTSGGRGARSSAFFAVLTVSVGAWIRRRRGDGTNRAA
ncbi:MAG: DUF11 domain-containing protein [Myxococcota bacterium]